MVLRFRCTCGKALKAPDTSAGKMGRCAHCGRKIRIPVKSSRENDMAQDSGEATQILPSGALCSAPTPNLPPEGHKGRVIVADAHDEHRRSHMSMLREHGYFVVEAVDGPTAIRNIHTCRPDAAIIDMHLDIQNGFRVMEHIRDMANPLNKHCWNMPVLVTSKQFNGRDRQYARHLGASACIAKPLIPADFFHKLEKAIRERQRRWGEQAPGR